MKSGSRTGRLSLFLVSLLGMLALSSGAAFAAPIVTNLETTENSLNTTTVKATIDPNGANVQSYFLEYGKTQLYGHKTEPRYPQGGGTVKVEEVLAGLDPLTTYHVRLRTWNKYGSTTSQDLIFEMLLAWKVNGQYATETPPLEGDPGISYGSAIYSNRTAFTLESPLGGEGTLKITCDESGYAENAHGFLEVSYDFLLTNCETWYGGEKLESCTPLEEEGLPGGPPAVSFNLDSRMRPTENFRFDEECAFGTELPLVQSGGGFAIGSMGEAKTHEITLTERSWLFEPDEPLTITISYPKWSLSNNQTFGIS